MLLQLALRNALRNRRRTLLTATTVLLGTMLLTVAMSWVTGALGGMLDTAARQIGYVRVVHADYARREQLMPLSDNLAQTDALVAAVSTVPGVVQAHPRILTGVTVATAEGEIGERFGLVVGAPISYMRDVLGLHTDLVEGRMIEADGEVIVGRTLVEEAGAKLGGDIILLGQTQDGSLSPVKLALVGIADLGNTTQNRQIFVTLEKARWMADIPEGATEVVAWAPDRDAAAEIAEAIRALPEAQGRTVQAWSERKPFDEMLGIVGTVQGLAASMIVFITALGVLNTMLMSVLERTAEIGVLRALGLKRREVVSLFVLEALGIATLGGIAGAALGGALGAWLEVHGVNLGAGVNKLPANMPMASTVYPDMNAQIIVAALGLALVMAVIGGALPAWRASRIEPVEAMRHRR